MKLKKFDFKKVFKVISCLLLVDLVYLNIILPVVLSAQQIYLIAENVVEISVKKNIDLNNITPKQFEELCNLAIERVVKIFKDNGFRVMPQALAATSGLELVPYGANVGSFGRLETRSGTLATQVNAILTGGFSLKNLILEKMKSCFPIP